MFRLFAFLCKAAKMKLELNKAHKLIKPYLEAGKLPPEFIKGAVFGKFGVVLK